VDSSEIKALFAEVATALKPLLEALQKATGSGKKEDTKEDEGGLGKLQGAVGGVVSVMGGMASAVQDTIGKLRGFVEALAPATMQAFDKAMRDLQATVGTAFEGVFEILTDVIRQVAGIILPVMEQLRPIIDQLVQSIAGILIPIVKVLATVFEALLPVLRIITTVIDVLMSVLKPVIAVVQMVATVLGFLLSMLEVALSPVIEILKVFGAVMDSIGQVMDVVATVLRTVVQTVQQFIQSLMAVSPLKFILDALMAATKKVIEIFLVAVAYIAKAIGALGFIDNLISNLRPRDGATAAAQNVSIKSIEQIAKDVSVAAAGASGSGRGRTQEDMMADVVRSLEDIRAGRNTSPIMQAIETMIRLLQGILNAVSRTVEVAGNVGGASVRALLGPIGLLF
jgi:hypothetical protein